VKLFDFTYFAESLASLITRLPVTLFIAFSSYILAMILGLLVALVKIYRVPVLKYLASVYISLIRGSPMLVQLFVICYGIPRVMYVLKANYGLFSGYNPNAIAPVYYAIITFIFNIGAYFAETVRAALEAVDVGQVEAAQSVGMTYPQVMKRILLPQAFTIAVPVIGNNLIGNVLETSFVFTIGVVDVMGRAKLIGARTTAYIEVYVAVALIYWGVCIILEQVFRFIERYLHKYRKDIA
jgi:L-cystine transport system permease protein